MASGARSLNQDLPRNNLKTDNVNGVLGMMSMADPIPEELSGSSYTITSTQSQFSYAVDNWIRGANNLPPTNNINNNLLTGMPGPRTVQSVQRPPQPPGPSSQGSGIWYTLAMILPLLTMNNARSWGCSASSVFHAAQFLTDQIKYMCRGIHRNLRNLAQDRIARDIFATAMDVVLIIYAIGFLILSMYQASIFN